MMRSSTMRASASLVFLFAAGSLALADGSAPPAAQGTKAPSETKPAAPAQAEPAKPTATEPKPAATEPKPAAAEPKPAPAAAKPPGTAATVVNLKTIEGVMGKAVRSRTGNEDMGHIVDVLVDANGEARAAVIDFGGFLGVGSRKVAVAWKTLDFADSIQSGSVKVHLTRDQVRQAPEYKADEPIVILEGTGGEAKEAAPKEAEAPKPAAPAAPAAPPPGHNQDSPAR